MEPTMKQNTERKQLHVLDDTGQVIGVISRPLETDALGPGREKVYLRRPTPAHGTQTPHAA